MTSKTVQEIDELLKAQQKLFVSMTMPHHVNCILLLHTRRQTNKSSMVQIRACNLFDANSLSEAKAAYFQLDPEK